MKSHLHDDLVIGNIVNVDERFKQVNGTDSDHCRCELNLQHPSINVIKPLWSIRRETKVS